jgi:hypothetical protein
LARTNAGIVDPPCPRRGRRQWQDSRQDAAEGRTGAHRRVREESRAKDRNEAGAKIRVKSRAEDRS